MKKTFIPHKENDFQPHILKPRSLFWLAVVLLLVKFLIFSWFFYLPLSKDFAVVTNSHLVELANQERVVGSFGGKEAPTAGVIGFGR